jgi:hypothetical protein
MWKGREMYVLCQDGKVIQRGFSSRAAAELAAKKHAEGYQRHSQSDKRRIPDFDVREDREVLAASNRNYRAYKEGERITWPT